MCKYSTPGGIAWLPIGTLLYITTIMEYSDVLRFTRVVATTNKRYGIK